MPANFVPFHPGPHHFYTQLLCSAAAINCGAIRGTEGAQQKPLPALGTYFHKTERVFFGRFPLLTQVRTLELQARASLTAATRPAWSHIFERTCVEPNGTVGRLRLLNYSFTFRAVSLVASKSASPEPHRIRPELLGSDCVN